MSTIKTVRFDQEVESMMERMLLVPVLESQDGRMLRTSEMKAGLLDPNLIMDARHRIFQEPLPISPTKSSVLKEARRLIYDEQTQALYQKREQELLESELKRFQAQLCKSRPRFRGPHTCTRKILADSSNEQFWRAATLATHKDLDSLRRAIAEESVNLKIDCINNNGSDDNDYQGQIKVTIKDKPVSQSKERRLDVLREVFDLLRRNAMQERRLRNLQVKVQEKVVRRRLERCFRAWRTQLEKTKELAVKRMRMTGMTEERKIEMFVNAIAEKRKELENFGQKSVAREPVSRISSGAVDEGLKRKTARRVFTVEAPAENRLSAQKKIIAEQRAKLVEQNRIIEEMRLQQIEIDARKASKETICAAKEALTNCGQRTRRTLMQLMREEGCRDKSLVEPPRLPSPPRFLIRMEARAEARRDRVKRAQELREKKIEEQKKREEAARKAGEEERRRLQQEAQKEARRLREEQEQRRAREAERSKKLNQMADELYRKFLIRHYIIEPFSKLVEMKYNFMKTAVDHYNLRILSKTFSVWIKETREQNNIKLELAVTVYNRTLLWYMFRDWKAFTKEEAQKYQVAGDFYDMRLQEKCLKTWCKRTLESKMKLLRDERMAQEHQKRRLRIKYFVKWKKYPGIAREMREKERRKDKWRVLVRRVIPDFDPKQRGVAMED